MTLPQRTFPDWGAAVSPLISPDVDVAELASRMGSHANLRRGGRVTYMDSFDQGVILWTLVNSFEYYGVKAYRAPAAIRMSPLAGAAATMTRYFPPIFVGKHGAEITFRFDSGLDGLYLVMTKSDGTAGGHQYSGNIVLNFVDLTIKIHTVATGDYLQVGDLNNYLYYGYNNLKLICDLENNRYVSYWFNSDNIAIDYPMWDDGVAPYEYYNVRVGATDTAGLSSAYIGDFIATMAEAT